MNDIVNRAVESLKERLPSAKVHVDEPLAKAGTWHVDVSLVGHAVVLQWSPKRGFGVSADPDPGLGEGPHEVFDELEKAVDRVVRLLETGEHTHPPQKTGFNRIAFECMEAEHWEHKETQPYVCFACFRQAVRAAVVEERERIAAHIAWLAETYEHRMTIDALGRAAKIIREERTP